MLFKSRRSSTARREVADVKPHADDDDAGIVVRKDRAIRRARQTREPAKTDASSALLNASDSNLYSNGALEQLRKEQRRITNTYSGYETMQVDTDVPGPQSQIPTEESIAAAKRKRQQLREAISAPQYIPLQQQEQPIAVAGNVYGPGSGASALVREDDDDEVPDILETTTKAPLSTVLEDIEEDDNEPIGSSISSATMSSSEAEIRMAILTRLEECRTDSAALSREADQIGDRLTKLNIENELITNQITQAEEKYLGLQELHATVSSLLECVSGKAQIIDQLWEEYRDVRQDRHRHMNEMLSLHWSDQDRPASFPQNSNQDDMNDEADMSPEARAAVQAGRRERSRKRRSAGAQTESSWMDGWTTYGDTDVERESFQLMMEIEGRARQVFSDVIDRFSTVDAVLEIFTKWRNSFREEYENAYCDLSLPRLLAPYIKLILISGDVTSAKGLVPLIAATKSVCAFSSSVSQALISALIGPFLTTVLMTSFSPFSMRDMIRCRTFCEQIREHFASVEIATSLRMLLVQADDKRQEGRRLGSTRHWARSLKLLYSMKCLEELLGRESQFMINSVTSELQGMANSERRRMQLSSVLQRDLTNLSTF